MEHWTTAEGQLGNKIIIFSIIREGPDKIIDSVMLCIEFFQNHKDYLSTLFIYDRQKLFRHKHEAESGRTSSVGNDILGFDSAGQVRLDQIYEPCTIVVDIIF